MSAPLKLNINPEVFKIKDPRVDKLKEGKLSAEGFSFLLSDRDPFVLIGNTIYALTEAEFYALRAVYPINEMTEEGFHKFLEMEDLSFMHKVDRDFVAQVKKELPTCPRCKYKRYQDAVYKLAKKYNIDLIGTVPAEPAPDVLNNVVYPDSNGPVMSYVSALVDHMYKIPKPVRRDCLDCVEKHVAQAWVLGNEALMGYPSHLTLAVAHLSEALDEMPKEFTALHDTIEFCLGKTNVMRRVFMPLGLVLPLINEARQKQGTAFEYEHDDVTEERSEVMEIDFTFPMREELSQLDFNTLHRVFGMLSDADKVILEYKSNPDYKDRIIWEGALGCAADAIAAVAPVFANMLRNRRLLFVADPGLAQDTGYRFTDVLVYLKELLDQNVVEPDTVEDSSEKSL